MACIDNHFVNNKKTIIKSLIIIFSYMIIEVIGGVITNSLTLLADAGHMLNDCFSLFISLLVIILSNKKATNQMTYGYKRAEIIGSIFNGLTLILLSFWIIYEAFFRLKNPVNVHINGIFFISIIGLFINVIVAYIMLNGSNVKTNLNMRGAYMHVVGDILGSIAAILSAILIKLFNYYWIDSLISIIISIIIFRSGYIIFIKSLNIIMEALPNDLNVQDIKNKILSINQIKDIHHLHVWSITSDFYVLTCHVVVGDISVKESESILIILEKSLKDLNINHITIQFETNSHRHNNFLLCNLNN